MSFIRRGLAAIALVSAVLMGTGIGPAHAFDQKDVMQTSNPCSDRFAWHAATVCQAQP